LLNVEIRENIGSVVGRIGFGWGRENIDLVVVVVFAELEDGSFHKGYRERDVCIIKFVWWSAFSVSSFLWIL
jgi:hypothetical protein